MIKNNCEYELKIKHAFQLHVLFLENISPREIKWWTVSEVGGVLDLAVIKISQERQYADNLIIGRCRSLSILFRRLTWGNSCRRQLVRNQLPVGGILLPGGWGCGRGGGVKLLQPPVPYNYKLSGGIKNTGTWYLLTDGLQSLYCRRTFPFIFTCPNNNIGILYVTN